MTVNNDAATLDLSNLAADLSKAAEQAQVTVMDVLVSMADQIADFMRQEVPVDTGKLRDSIRVKVMADRIEIGPEGVDYAVYVHYGTAPHEIRPTTEGGKLAFEVDGKTVFASVVQHPGTSPNPFAERAAQRFLDTLGTQAADAGVRLITGGSSKGASGGKRA